MTPVDQRAVFISIGTLADSIAMLRQQLADHAAAFDAAQMDLASRVAALEEMLTQRPAETAAALQAMAQRQGQAGQA